MANVLDSPGRAGKANPKKDNTTFAQKVAIRRMARRQLAPVEPVVMETHGGLGALFNACYADLPTGVVFEKKPERAEHLARQRPTWAVYEADCVKALAAGVGGHAPVNLLDLAPYGEPWPAIESFFGSPRQFADVMVIVVNDGLRQGLRMGRAWAIESLREAVAEFGNDIHDDYLAVCQWLLKKLAAQAGYDLSRFAGYYAGHVQQMTHYIGILQRSES